MLVSPLLVPQPALLALAQDPPSSPTAGSQSHSAEITSFQNVSYNAMFYRENMSMHIVGKNTNSYRVDHTGLVITVGKYRLFESNLSLGPSEQKSWNINITPGLDVLENNHSVVVSTYGDSAQFNFTKEINSLNPGPIPTPHIKDIEVTNGTIDGEPSAVAKVTVANPSIQTYPTKLMVHTLGTDGSFYGASVAPGGEITFTVELLDERGSQIAGEARLYAGNLSEGDGAIDQAGFVGQAGEDTRTWNETYEPVEGPWQNDGYEYTNESIEDDTSLAERLSGGHQLLGIPIIYWVAALIVGTVLVRRRR